MALIVSIAYPLMAEVMTIPFKPKQQDVQKVGQSKQVLDWKLQYLPEGQF